MPTEKSKGDVSDLAQEIDEAARATDLIPEDSGATRFGRAVNKVAEVAGVAVFATILFLVFFNAFARYAFQFTFIWGDEIVLALLPWLGMFGMFLAIRRRQIIRIDFFANACPPPVRRFLELFAPLFAAAAFLWLAVVSIQYVELFGGDRTIYTKIRMGWFMSAMVIGPALACFAYLVLMYEDFRNRHRTETAR